MQGCCDDLQPITAQPTYHCVFCIHILKKSVQAFPKVILLLACDSPEAISQRCYFGECEPTAPHQQLLPHLRQRPNRQL